MTQDFLEQFRARLPAASRMKDILPRHVEMVDSSFGPTPLGSVASYQLREKPTYTANLKTESSPAQTGTHPAKTGANPSTTRVPSDGNPLKQVYFPALPLSKPVDVKAKEGVSEWPIDLDLSQGIEARTRGQASNSEWQDLHTYTITASKFKKVCRDKKCTSAFLKGVFEKTDLDAVPAIRHGREMEPQAVQAYKKEKREAGNPVEVRGCGGVLQTQFQYIGASPDGLVFDETASPRYGLLEVKCPHNAYSQCLSVHEACSQLHNFCCEVSANGEIRVSETHAYYYQMQGQMAVCAAKWCDFVVFVRNDIFVERVQYDPAFWEMDMLPALVGFYNLHAIPYLQQNGRTVPPTSSCTNTGQRTMPLTSSNLWVSMLVYDTQSYRTCPYSWCSSLEKLMSVKRSDPWSSFSSSMVNLRFTCFKICNGKVFQKTTFSCGNTY